MCFSGLFGSGKTPTVEPATTEPLPEAPSEVSEEAQAKRTEQRTKSAQARGFKATILGKDLGKATVQRKTLLGGGLSTLG